MISNSLPPRVPVIDTNNIISLLDPLILNEVSYLELRTRIRARIN